MWSGGGLNWRSQVGANPIPIPHPTNLALFGHKITLYRFNQGRGFILLQGAQIGAGGWAPWPPHFNHCLNDFDKQSNGRRTGVESWSTHLSGEGPSPDRWVGGHNYDSSSIRRLFDGHSTLRACALWMCVCVCVCVCVWRCSHSVWSSIQPTYVLLISFIRCQLTVTVTLMTVVVTKVSRMPAYLSAKLNRKLLRPRSSSLVGRNWITGA